MLQTFACRAFIIFIFALCIFDMHDKNCKSLMNSLQAMEHARLDILAPRAKKWEINHFTFPNAP